MSPTRLISLIGAGLVLAAALGCVGSRPGSTSRLAQKGAAPDDVALHGNQNAPYIMLGGPPRLISRATETDTKDARPCSPEVLSADEIAGNANGSYRSVKLAFMNRGPVPCRLGGYPGVSLLDASGERMGSVTIDNVTEKSVVAELSPGQTVSTPGQPAGPSITLMPHQVAAFEVVWTTAPECSRVGRIVVTAPGSAQQFSIAQPMRVCAGRIQVTQLRLDEGNV